MYAISTSWKTEEKIKKLKKIKIIINNDMYACNKAFSVFTLMLVLYWMRLANKMESYIYVYIQ